VSGERDEPPSGSSGGRGNGVSVVILNFNGGSRGSECVASVLASELREAEVILFDNGSTDASLAEIRQRFGGDPRVSILAGSTNLGFGGGNNEAARHARGDVLLFLNNDTQLVSPGIVRLVDRIRADPTIGIALPLTTDGLHGGGPSVGALDFLGRPSFLRAPSPDDPARETIASGPAFAIRRSVWERVGGYDADYFLFMEDIDLAWRVMLAGFRVCIVPEVSVLHEGGASTRHVPATERAYLRTRNSLVTLMKNYSLGSLIVFGPIAMSSLFATAGMLSRGRRSTEYLDAFSRAVRWNLENLAGTAAKRRRIQSGRQVSDRSILRRMTVPILGRH
jgi:GT2 family glycosyltransferase